MDLPICINIKCTHHRRRLDSIIYYIDVRTRKILCKLDVVMLDTSNSYSVDPLLNTAVCIAPSVSDYDPNAQLVSRHCSFIIMIARGACNFNNKAWPAGHLNFLERLTSLHNTELLYLPKPIGVSICCPCSLMPLIIKQH